MPAIKHRKLNSQTRVILFGWQSSLKGHIHNPNAPEMIHYMFKPLAMVVDSIRDPASGAPTLAMKVMQPLLSVESVQLLNDCLSTRENQLWVSLGEPWTRSR